MRNNKQPTKGLPEQALIQGSPQPAEGRGPRLNAQSHRALHILITAWSTNGVSCASEVGGGPTPSWVSLLGVEMYCWQPLSNSHSNRGSGSAPASSLSLELGLIVSRWQRPSRQLSLEVWRGTGTARREKRANEKGPSAPAALASPPPLPTVCTSSEFGVMLQSGAESQAAKHRSTVAYTIALQTATNNFHYPSQIESFAWPSCLNPSPATRPEA